MADIDCIAAGGLGRLSHFTSRERDFRRNPTPNGDTENSLQPRRSAASNVAEFSLIELQPILFVFFPISTSTSPSPGVVLLCNADQLFQNEIIIIICVFVTFVANLAGSQKRPLSILSCVLNVPLFDIHRRCSHSIRNNLL